MEHSQFDEALRDILQSSELPYEPQQWNLMEARLDGVQKPVQKRSIIPLGHWVSAAAAACFVVMLGWYAADYQRVSKKNNRDAEIAVIKSKTPEQKAKKSIAARNNDRKPADKISGIRSTQRSVVVAVNKVRQAAPPTIAKPPLKSDNTESTIIADKETEEPSRQIAASEKTRAISLFPDEEPKLAKSSTTAFDINGGYNISNAKNNFTLGVTVKQKLGRKLHLETGIAVVSSSHTAYTKVVSQGTSIGPLAGKAIEYHASTANLLYLQAAPSLSYQVYRGLSAGGGVDAQRLLSDADKAMSINNLGEATTPQPDWDFGLTGRLDYRVIKRLRAGLMYRESIHALSKSAADAARRNYLLLQLSYTIL